MAGPTIASSTKPLWNPVGNILTISWSALLTAAAGLPNDLLYTDVNSVVWNGASTTANTYQMQKYAAGTPGTASTVTIAAGAFSSAGGNSLLISNQAVNLAFDHTIAQGAMTSADVTALWTALDTSFATGNFTDYDAVQLADLRNLFNRLLKTPVSAAQGYLVKAPRTEDRAYALLTQWQKFLQSAKVSNDFALLGAAMGELQTSLNRPNTLAMTAAGA